MRFGYALIPVIALAVTTLIIVVLRWLIEFGHPNVLWLNLLVGVWGAIWAWSLAWRANVSEALYGSRDVEENVASFSIRRSIARFVLIASALFTLVLAAAEPQWGEVRRQVQRQGIDIVLAVDASRSMLAEDVAPDRLRAATEEVHQLLRTLNGDRVGLVVFAGFAFTQSPLTSDYGAIRLYLDRIRPDALPAQGTAIGRAIQEGHRLLNGNDDPDFKRAPTQMIVVISDGEDHETNPVAAALAAKEDGIRVYTIGLGTTTGGRIPLREPRGNITGYLTDRAGNTVHTKLVDDQLREIAEAGGGQYIHFAQPGSAARHLNSEIQRFERASVSSVLRSQYVSRPYLALALAFCFLIMALLIDPRPRKERSRIGDTRLMWLIVLLTLSSSWTMTGCYDFRRQDPHVRASIELAEAGQVEEALERLGRAGEDAQRQHGFNFNRGRLYELQEQWEPAQAEYLRSLASSTESLRIASMIGLGNAFVGQKGYEAALERYRRALMLDPDNAIARRNYEIAHRLLFPHCSTLEDPFEPNNTEAQASPLPPDVYVGEWAKRYQQVNSPNLPASSSTTSEKTKFISCGTNDDLFALPLEGGEKVNLKVDFRRLREDDGGAPLPERIPAHAVRIAILDALGEAVAVDQGLQDATSDHVDAKRIQRQISDLIVDGARAPFYLKVSTNAGLEYEYSLALDIVPPCSAVDDTFEDNDAFNAAAALEPGEHELRICNEDADWFNVALSPGDDLFVDVQTGQDKSGVTGAIETTLSDSATNQRAAETGFLRIDPRTGLEARSLRNVSKSTTASIGIRNLDGFEGNYALSVYRFAPCPSGNDRFEPNNRPNHATSLTAQQNELRHLRLCPGDEDWFMMQLPPKEEASSNNAQGNSEDEPIRFAALAEYESAERNLIIELWDPSTGRMIARSEPASGTAYQSEAVGAAVTYTELPAGTQTVLVRVLGDAGYYHLKFPDTQPPSSSDSSSSDSSDDSEDPSDDSQDSEQSDGEEEEDEQNNASESDEDEQNADQEEQDQAEAPPEQSQNSAEDERRALMQLLESLEDENMNLQLMQALERQPPVRTQNEW